MIYEPVYSGPGKSGICVCGHRWEQHHLFCVMKQERIEQTHEGYILGGCLAHGFNEVEGMMLVDGEWVEHCYEYRDCGAIV